MPSNLSITVNDYDGQAGIVGFQCTEITDTNIVGVGTAFGTFRTTMMALLRGVAIQSQMTILSKYENSDAKATDDLAQRGNKWRVAYRDNTQWLDSPTNTIPNYGYRKSFDLELPTANLTLRENNSDVIYTQAGGGVGAGAAAINAFVAAFNNLVRSPYGGDAQVVMIEAVTRTGG
jgi:hypothetical protein